MVPIPPCNGHIHDRSELPAAVASSSFRFLWLGNIYTQFSGHSEASILLLDLIFNEAIGIDTSDDVLADILPHFIDDTTLALTQGHSRTILIAEVLDVLLRDNVGQTDLLRFIVLDYLSILDVGFGVKPLCDQQKPLG